MFNTPFFFLNRLSGAPLTYDRCHQHGQTAGRLLSRLLVVDICVLLVTSRKLAPHPTQ